MSGPQTAPNTAARSFRMIAAGLLASLVTACGGPPPSGVTTPAMTAPPSSANIAATTAADTASDASRRHDTVTSAGHYLAARQALYFNDVGQPATISLETLKAEADSIPLLRQAFLTQ